MDQADAIVDKMLCMGCLCIGRNLIEVCDLKMQQFYLEALGDISVTVSRLKCPKLCFECLAALSNAVRFREQVKYSYRILQTYTSENIDECQLTDIARPSRLKHHNIKPISVLPIDYLTCDIDADENRVYVKEEVKDEWELLDNTSVDLHSEDETQPLCKIDELQPLSTIDEKKTIENSLPPQNEDENTSTEGIKKERKKLSKIDKKTKNNKLSLSKKIIKRLKNGKKKKRSLKKNSKDLNIITINLSYEEMLLEREKEAKKDSYIKSEFKCESCIVGFSYKKTQIAHFASKHSQEIGNYVCPICKTVMVSEESFTSHYKRHMKRYECIICSRRCMDLKVMQQHYFSAHDIKLKKATCTCNICGKVSESLDKHRYHKDTHKARVQCPECEKTFSHRAGLMNHRLTVHECNNVFSCSVCHKVFKWKTSLKRHLAKHQAKDKQAEAAHCTLCGISFASHSSYQRHLRNSLRHVTHDEHKFICDHCERRFADKTKLRNHIEEKHLHKTYQCPICSKPSKNRIGLDQHIRNVHKRRPNDKMCHHCGKGFPTKAQLESHIRTHTGERPFSCKFCPTTFSQQSNLYKHNRQVHLNIKSKRYPAKKPLATDGNQTVTHEQQLGATTEPLPKPVVMINFPQENNRLVYFNYT